ncbi:MAG: hypothetical protein KatS3mg030_305 [Saprospiraceae bacterium]|nr:MAG: hypothetical protein KatS3mg030_305 [Saprospiraceae bacterium]
MLFQNQQIELTSLPAVEDVDFQPLSPTYRTVAYLGTSISFGILFIGWWIFQASADKLAPWIPWLALSGLAGLYVISMSLVGLRYRMSGYALREHDVLYRTGALFHSLTAIPYKRIQHVEVSQGPLQSAFGIATLKVYTAGGSRSDLSIEGLPHKEAQRIREFITRKVAELSATTPGEQRGTDSVSTCPDTPSEQEFHSEPPPAD